MYKEEVKKKFTHQDKSISAWDTAIIDAEEMIKEEKKKIERLRRSIRAFKELRDSGHPFPRSASNQNETEISLAQK